MSSKRAMNRGHEPEFLRFITDSDLLFQAKLPVPRKFMRENGSALSGSLLIKVPSGMTWKVVLVKRGVDTLFGKGWEEFVVYHQLMCGHSMVFRYEGGCSFRVSIFDKDFTEIAYPCSPTNTAGEEDLNRSSITEERNIKEEEEDDCPEFVDEVPPSLKKKCNMPTGYFKPEERSSNTNKSTDRGGGEEEDAETEFINEHPQSLEKKRGVPMPCLRPEKRIKIKTEANVEDQEGEECMPNKDQTRSGRTRVGKRKKTLTRKDKADALQRAAGFKSAKPFFTVVMQPTYGQKGYLPIPSKFSKLHLRKKYVGATLSCGSRKIWPVGFHNNKTHKRITSGWAGFANDNGLEAGDVCAFELIKATEISFKVIIFRATEDAQLS